MHEFTHRQFTIHRCRDMPAKSEKQSKIKMSMDEWSSSRRRHHRHLRFHLHRCRCLFSSIVSTWIVPDRFCFFFSPMLLCWLVLSHSHRVLSMTPIHDKNPSIVLSTHEMAINTSHSNKFYCVSACGEVWRRHQRHRPRKLCVPHSTCLSLSHSVEANPQNPLVKLKDSSAQQEQQKQITHTRTYSNTHTHTLTIQMEHEYISYLTKNENNKWKYYCRLNACLFLYEYVLDVDSVWLGRMHVARSTISFQFEFDLMWFNILSGALRFMRA